MPPAEALGQDRQELEHREIVDGQLCGVVMQEFTFSERDRERRPDQHWPIQQETHGTDMAFYDIFGAPQSCLNLKLIYLTINKRNISELLLNLGCLIELVVVFVTDPSVERAAISVCVELIQFSLESFES